MPIFDLTDPEQQIKALEYLTKSIAAKDILIMEDVVPKTDKQNRYLHLCLAVYAMEVGSPIEWVKVEIFKKVCNTEIFLREFVVKETGEQCFYLRSWADLKKHEAKTAIDRFIFYCVSECGLEMPDPKMQNKRQIAQIWADIEKNKEFL